MRTRRPTQSTDDQSTPQNRLLIDQPRGRKRSFFPDLSENTKDKYSRTLAQNETLESLLRSAEKAAHRDSLTNVAKVLNSLRTCGETYANSIINSPGKLKRKACVESSLLLKTRVGLSKRKYQALEKFTRRVYGVKLLLSWSKIMEHRNKITPKISCPTKIDGVLTSHVTLHDMVVNDVTRMLELDEVANELSVVDGEDVDCTLHVSAGVDSATGFPHYNQATSLKQDDSLLSEHVMPLMLVTGEKKLWVNPNPQSDTFCHAKSMTWAKETNTRTKQIYDAFYSEVDRINNQPIVIESKVYINKFRTNIL